MDFSVLNDLNSALSLIKLGKKETIVNALNEIIAPKAYYIDGDNILLHDYISIDYINNLNFEDYYIMHTPGIDSLFPIKIDVNDNNLLIDDICIAPDCLNIPKKENYDLRKKFIKWYLNDLVENSKINLSKLTTHKKFLEKSICYASNSYDINLNEFIDNLRYVSYSEIIRKKFHIVELPIYPTNEMKLFIIKDDIKREFKYAYELCCLNDSLFYEVSRLSNNIYEVPFSFMYRYKPCRISVNTLLQINPHILDDFYHQYDIEYLKMQVMYVEKEKNFIKELRKDNNLKNAIIYSER